MTLIPCPECKTHMSDQALACPKCGYGLQVQKRKAEKAYHSEISTVIGGLIFVFLVYHLHQAFWPSVAWAFVIMMLLYGSMRLSAKET